MGTPTNPEPGDMHIDATAVPLHAVADEDIRRKVKLREGSDKAMANILRLTDEEVAQAGLNMDDVNRLRGWIGEYRLAAQFLDSAERMTEKLEQTTLCHGHEISLLIGEIASQARRRARQSPHRGAILDSLGDVLEYQSAPAKKAAATREQKAPQNGEEPQEAPPAPAARPASRKEKAAGPASASP